MMWFKGYHWSQRFFEEKDITAFLQTIGSTITMTRTIAGRNLDWLIGVFFSLCWKVFDARLSKTKGWKGSAGLGGLAQCHCCCCCWLNKLGSILGKTHRAHLNNLKRFVKTLGFSISNKARIGQEYTFVLPTLNVQNTNCLKRSSKVLWNYWQKLQTGKPWKQFRQQLRSVMIPGVVWNLLKTSQELRMLMTFLHCLTAHIPLFHGAQRTNVWFVCSGLTAHQCMTWVFQCHPGHNWGVLGAESGSIAGQTDF